MEHEVGVALSVRGSVCSAVEDVAFYMEEISWLLKGELLIGRLV